jgi:hypothetical protein
MKLMIESTDKVALIDGVPCRFWDGVTESGSRCVVFVHRIAANPDDLSEFESELIQGLKPDNVEVRGMRQDWG